MLRNRSRAAVSSKQALGSDRGATLAPAQNNTTKPVSYFLGSQRFFGGFFTKVKVGGFDANLMSPTSTFDMKPIFTLDRIRPFGYGETNIQQSPRVSDRKRPWDTSSSTAIGLALIIFPDETPDMAQYQQATRMVTFTPHLKVQIPPDLLASPADSPHFHSDYGTRTRNQQLISPKYFLQTRISPVTKNRLTVAEMELSEDYTRVTSRGPIQTTTHIFDNCIVKSHGFAAGCSITSAKTNKEFLPVPKNSFSDNFLGHCYTCKKSLSHNKDIYIYRYTTCYFLRPRI